MKKFIGVMLLERVKGFGSELKEFLGLFGIFFFIVILMVGIFMSPLFSEPPRPETENESQNVISCSEQEDDKNGKRERGNLLLQPGLQRKV